MVKPDQPFLKVLSYDFEIGEMLNLQENLFIVSEEHSRQTDCSI